MHAYLRRCQPQMFCRKIFRMKLLARAGLDSCVINPFFFVQVENLPVLPRCLQSFTRQSSLAPEVAMKTFVPLDCRDCPIVRPRSCLRIGPYFSFGLSRLDRLQRSFLCRPDSARKNGDEGDINKRCKKADIILSIYLSPNEGNKSVVLLGP